MIQGASWYDYQRLARLLPASFRLAYDGSNLEMMVTQRQQRLSQPSRIELRGFHSRAAPTITQSPGVSMAAGRWVLWQIKARSRLLRPPA